jgi:hypothetical protein
LNHASSKAQVVQGGSRQTAAELFEEPAFLKMSQFLHKNRITNKDLQDTSVHTADSRLPGTRLADRLGPCLLQAGSLSAPAPTPRQHQPADNVAKAFRTFLDSRAHDRGITM